ncbi:hypothetical protein ABIB57_004421 [Devosia sp. UYZn731]|uniref:hypothetical protein n=1 Tax=Devosia sp. UYZn731 TaxID=3156345 RepID=UPI00339B206E
MGIRSKFPARRVLLSAFALWPMVAMVQPGAAQEPPAPTASDATEFVPTKPIVYRPFRRGVSETVQLPANLQQVRRRLIAGSSVRTADLRSLADAGDSLAQMRFAKQLAQMTGPNLQRAQIHYYAMAAYNGREGAVRPLLSLLRANGGALDAAALANAEAALTAQASHGQIDAISGLAKFYMAGSPFGLKETEGRDMMARVAKAGDYKTALDLALHLLGDPQNAVAMAEAREYLTIAAASPEPALRATALSLLNSSGGI